MAKEIKKRKIVLHKDFNGIGYDERLQIAYEEWQLGKAESDKYHIYPQDFSKYLSYRLDLNKTKL